MSWWTWKPYNLDMERTRKRMRLLMENRRGSGCSNSCSIVSKILFVIVSPVE